MTMDANLLDVAERVAMVSGASRGIGEAIARRLLDDGYRLSLGVRDVAATRERFPEDDSRLIVEHFDALQPATAESWVSSTLDHFGALDALVNNAGIWKQVNFETGSEQDLDDMWEVNVKAAFRLIRLALPHLKTCGNGRIVNIASTDGIRFRDTTCSIGYTMSKHALVAMSLPGIDRHARQDRFTTIDLLTQYLQVINKLLFIFMSLFHIPRQHGHGGKRCRQFMGCPGSECSQCEDLIRLEVILACFCQGPVPFTNT